VPPDAFVKCAVLLAAPFIGSFLGTLALRLPKGEPVLGGRSACPACGHVLGPLELIPLASWAILRGRCRSCGAAISAFYPAIELAALAVAAAAAATTSGAGFYLACLIGWALLVPAAMAALRLLKR
jgi:leader peptidase (prepilin peptidase)/N-methyltransferase